MQGDEDMSREGPEKGGGAAASMLPEQEDADVEEKPRGRYQHLIQMNKKKSNKRKGGIGRHSKGQDRKKSKFDHAGARAHYDLPPTAPPAQISASISRSARVPPKPRSPTKKVVKATLRKMTNELNRIQRKRKSEAEDNAAFRQVTIKKINTLEDQVRRLNEDLVKEKKASRTVITKAMDRSRDLYRDGEILLMEAKEREREADDAIRRCQDKANEKALKERFYASAHHANVTKKHKADMKVLREQHEAVLRSNVATFEKKKKKMVRKLAKDQAKLDREREQWQAKLDEAGVKLDFASDALVNEKRRSREYVQNAVDEIKERSTYLQGNIDKLENMQAGLETELKVAKAYGRAAKRMAVRHEQNAAKRQKKYADEMARRQAAEDDLARCEKQIKKQQATIEKYEGIINGYDEKKKLEMKQEWVSIDSNKRKGKGGGGKDGGRTWGVWVVQMICELLTAGSSPKAVQDSLRIVYETLYQVKQDSVPSLNFIRRCRTVVQVMGETMTAIKLGGAEKWGQAFADATTRRQLAFQAFIIGLMVPGGDDGSVSIDPVVVSSCIFMEDERSETQVESIVEKLHSLKDRLKRLKDVMDKVDPDNNEVPPPESIDMKKFDSDSVVITDTCSTAQKVRRIFLEYTDGANEYDCMHHLRNVWFGNMEKALTKELNAILQESLSEIDPKLRVTASISAIIRAVDKEFSLSANYPKGHGDLFAEWMRENHSGELLLHVERAAGSRQDLCLEGCLPIFWNYEYYLEFLDDSLRQLGKSNKASILQKNLFCALGSMEMISLSRLLSILHLAICIPFRWLSGKTHELAEFNWGPMSMGRVLDKLDVALNKLLEKPDLIVDEQFMMGIFDEFANELPPFKEYISDLYEKKQMSVVARQSGAKVVQFNRLRQSLFSPTRPTDVETTPRVIQLASIAATAVLKELHDESKATHKYLSKNKKEHSWDYCPDSVKTALLGKKATNDEAESSLGGTTHQIQKYGRINVYAASAIADMRRNAFMHRPGSGNEELGLFHQFSSTLQEAIIKVAMFDAPETRKSNNSNIQKQQRAKRKKKELLKQLGMKKAQEAYIDAIYYHRMYYSEACWKGDPKVVTANLRRFKSESSKYEALKENIRIRVKGFGWQWAHHAWSKNGDKYTVKQLADHLKYIIREENKPAIKATIPPEPKTELPKRQATGILGTAHAAQRSLDSKFMGDEAEWKKKVEKIRLERESKGEGSIFSQMQPLFAPSLKSIEGRRIDVLFDFTVTIDGGGEELGVTVKKSTDNKCFVVHSIQPDSKFANQVEVGDVVVKTNGNARVSACSDARSIHVKKLRWCQGVLEKELNDTKALVRWDAMPDVDGSKEAEWGNQDLKPRLFNKNRNGAWRMDVDVGDVVPTEDDDDDDCSPGDVDEMDESDAEEDIGSVSSASSAEESISSYSSDGEE